MTTLLTERYHSLCRSIAESAQKYGRNPSEISLIAVSKNRPLPEILELYHAGQRSFAESRVQGFLEKIVDCPINLDWHFIGPLQKNKVRKVVSTSSLIHSVDSMELAKKIHYCSEEMGHVCRILLQINTSGETSKQGMTVEECEATIEEFLALSSIKIEGFMTMAPWREEQAIIHSCFAKLRALRECLQQRFGKASFPHLSMGMSHDYKIAIAEGATLLRIGTALFEG